MYLKYFVELIAFITVLHRINDIFKLVKLILVYYRKILITDSTLWLHGKRHGRIYSRNRSKKGWIFFFFFWEWHILSSHGDWKAGNAWSHGAFYKCQTSVGERVVQSAHLLCNLHSTPTTSEHRPHSPAPPINSGVHNWLLKHLLSVVSVDIINNSLYLKTNFGILPSIDYCNRIDNISPWFAHLKTLLIQNKSMSYDTFIRSFSWKTVVLDVIPPR